MAEQTARTYSGTEIAVGYDTALCRHAAECVHGLPEVFDLERRPWIHPDDAAPDAVADVIRRCPTGALTYRYADGRDEEPERPTTVRRTPDGRLLVRGELAVEVPGGPPRAQTRAMLCGCGRAAEDAAPYCDRSGPCADTPRPDGAA